MLTLTDYNADGDQQTLMVTDEGGLRLDRYLCYEYKEISRSQIKRLLDAGYITVNNAAAKANYKVKSGDKIRINLPPSPDLTPEDISLSIIYEDSDLLVIDKPPGLVVHPAPGHPHHTLVNALLARCPDLSSDGSVRPGIVHRLDKDTSGLMVVAKNNTIQRALAEQLRNHSMKKRYLVLVKGHLTPERGVIEAPIGRDQRHRKRLAISAQGKEARTLYHVVEYLADYTLLEVTLETGRTHQIRVHFSAIGHPVVGDTTYGRKSPLVGRQFIHACHLGFRLPSTGEYVEFDSELPPELKWVLRKTFRAPKIK
jgi:23S rRNA pseudouridine1911/1915/1917 synthase